jgi:hypothetical protein
VRQLESADDDSRGSDEPESAGASCCAAEAPPSSPTAGLAHCDCESSESAPELVVVAGVLLLGASLPSTRFLRYEFQ